jgi:two-component system CheB/CheR fusion protein
MAPNNDRDRHERSETRQRTSQPTIVGIGASAGGLQALQALFDEIPADTGAAFVVVVHLDPQSRSDLSRILGTRTRMRVVQVGAPETLHANHVYVIPPDRRLQLTDHEIIAAQFDEPRGHRAPIDLFFRSLAEHGDGFAVVLTGAGSDGAIGVRAIKETGGIILVQDPNEAEYPSMPRSAIATGIADFVLPVRDLAARLVDLIRNRESAAPLDPLRLDEDVLLRILAYVRVRTGHDFTRYKRSTIQRRIARRVQVTRTEDLTDYYNFLRNNTGEAPELVSDLLISVTTFFRDNEAFGALRAQVFPLLFAGKADPTESIRVWVPGCATGEEAYSIAILLLEETARNDIRPPIQVFGSDLDGRALATARDGRYPAAIEADVSEQRLRRFFMREGDHYRVRQELRDTVLFANHSLLKDPPFSRIDLVSCRNLLIYLDRELQQQVCSTFHYALNPGGFLFLGSSETADNPPGLFRMIHRTARIYQSTVPAGDRPRLLPSLLGGIGTREHAIPIGRAVSPGAALSEAVLHRRAIEQVAPPSILVDEAHRVLHLSENAGRYMQPSGGTMSGDVVDLVRPELRYELRTALHRAFEQRKPTLTLPMLVRFNGARHRVHVQVKPTEHDHQTRNAVVMFVEGEAVDETSLVPEQDQTTDETVRRLSQELEVTQSRLRTMREESESANEELRAANEELQSINEEYRSTSEELETSKEELQSINEELQTVNSELKHKLEAVSRAHSDLQNLMAAADFGTLFLDSGLRIKRFTERITNLFNLTSSDEGRPITDFAHQLEYDDLIKEARGVLSDLTPVRREVRSRQGHWYELRMRPYRTLDDRIDGVVITFIDVTERRLVEEALRERELELRQKKQLVDLSHDPIFEWDFDGGIIEWNRGSEELYGYTREEALGKLKEQILGTTISGLAFAELKAKLLEDGSWTGEIHQRTKDGRAVTVEARLQLVSFDGRRLVLESTRDITERKALEERQRLLLNELTHRVKNTLSVVQAIAHRTLRSAQSNQEFIQSFDGRLAALGRAHNLLTRSSWQGADLATLAREQLEAHASRNPERVRIEGEPVFLSPDLATPFGLVLHELATNAAKYGSLSRPNGAIQLSWTVGRREGQRLLTVTWRERGGPPAQRPTASGFGTTLIETGIPNARVASDYGADGFACTIEVPLVEAGLDGKVIQA